MNANGLRLLLVARLSRAKVSDRRDGVSIEIQDATAREWAEREGHAVIATAADIKSGTSAPWKRKNLRPWMEDPKRLAMYDAILIYRTDRISRGTQEDFTYLEHWAVSHGKRIIVADGPQFPKRNDADYWRWTAEKDAARKEWEAIRMRSMGTQNALKAQGHAVGKPPFGYVVTGATYAKRFEIDPVTGPLAREAFQRVADGRTATSVAVWLTEMTGEAWRVKRVIEMIKRRTYLGERDGHAFEPLVSEALWDSANTVMGSRSFATGGRRAIHGYSSVVLCECGAQLYRHQSTRHGKPIGAAKYRCSQGRIGLAVEAKCGNPGIPFDDANKAVDALMRDLDIPEWVMVTTGGDHGRQMELQRIQAEMNNAMTQKDMGLVTTLAAKFTEVDAQPAEPVRTMPRKTGRTYADAWRTGTLADQRALLGDHTVTVLIEADGTVKARLEDD
ncbi:recombinase family protein [Trebonia kvetii]|uniref:Recombinase family protein n=1 Tax=Trebonia kvetii TaxID=2480626 RepID=A0A6P2BZ70_9ACTN|nr:recombinase family protein [Trebonia kvetii]TVZ04007.1 recombinase family protein [Trebonia kvetii]